MRELRVDDPVKITGGKHRNKIGFFKGRDSKGWTTVELDSGEIVDKIPYNYVIYRSTIRW